MMKKHGLYYLRDKKTNEIIHASYYKEDLEFYKEHPDYNPNPSEFRSTNIQDFVNLENGKN